MQWVLWPTLALLFLVVVSSCAELPQRAEFSESTGVFQDCNDCPEMVVIPAGVFQMGAPASDRGRCCLEWLVRRVKIGSFFALSRFEVTFSQWERCVEDGGCRYMPDDEGWGRYSRPVINVSWEDANQYVEWLSQRTDRQYRLPSESEWEYAARAGTTTRYWWGNHAGRNRANCNGCDSRWGGKRTAVVGSFRANPFGLFDMNGNVAEWVFDCYGHYDNAPNDGSPATTGPGLSTSNIKEGKCHFRVLRGGSWFYGPGYIRSASRDYRGYYHKANFIGFRIAADASH